MHKFLKSIGFSSYTSTKKIQELVKNVIVSAENRNYTSADEESDTVLVEFSKSFAGDMGITVCGEFDENDNFIFYYAYPYIRGTGITSIEDVSVERHAATESYAGICDDMKVGVTIIFYLQNMIPYIKYMNTNTLPVKGTTLTLSALASQGSVMMPILKSEYQKNKIKKSAITRNRLIEAARHGDEDAMESLTLEDMDTYTTISKKIQQEDVYSLVDTYFMPYGVECDQYSVMGEILAYCLVSNNITGEEVYVMNIDCNELVFDICINKSDLYGEPEIGRRFKGTIWLQGYINYPE